jgi:predicted amidohydrolase YtcJ
MLIKITSKAVIALGTDFPVEEVNPMLTFHAATARKDSKGYPAKGFQTKMHIKRRNNQRDDDDLGSF